jgi:ribosomal RNA-processing protein 1
MTRMDKYLYLVRVYLRAAWKRLSRDDWADTVVLECYLDLLGSMPLHPTDRKVPDGMRYHVTDVYVDELEEVGLKKEQSELIQKLLGPLENLEKKSRTKTVRSRVREALEDPRVEEWLGKPKKEAETEVDEGENEEWGGIND